MDDPWIVRPADRKPVALLSPDRNTRRVFLEPLTVESLPTQVSGSNSGWIMDAVRHSRDGDVTSVLSSDGVVPPMNAGDSLAVHYEAADSLAAARRWLVTMVRPGTNTTRAHARKRVEAATATPLAFALLQNIPNPFEAATSIGFALPVATWVRLEVYDLLGRKVRTLANTTYPAGEHKVVWNRRTSSGALVAPGLYFYRMDAGQYREKRRMVILP